jgi:hypothetical protein
MLSSERIKFKKWKTLQKSCAERPLENYKTVELLYMVLNRMMFESTVIVNSSTTTTDHGLTKTFENPHPSTRPPTKFFRFI